MEDNIHCDLDQFADNSTAHTIGATIYEVLTNLRHNADNCRLMPNEISS